MKWNSGLEWGQNFFMHRETGRRISKRNDLTRAENCDIIPSIREFMIQKYDLELIIA